MDFDFIYNTSNLKQLFHFIYRKIKVIHTHNLDHFLLPFFLEQGCIKFPVTNQTIRHLVLKSLVYKVTSAQKYPNLSICYIGEPFLFFDLDSKIKKEINARFGPQIHNLYIANINQIISIKILHSST